MTFSEVIGQQAVASRLLQMEREQRLPHAIMLCGPTGHGTLALALAFASHILGDSPLLRHWQHPDLHFVFPVIKPAGAAADRRVTSQDYMAQWRDTLQRRGGYIPFAEWLQAISAENQQAVIYEAESDSLTHQLSLQASQGGYRVVLVWMPERMNATCANKILKLLEEPPAHTLFLMACEQPQMLLDTIRSRVQRIDVPRIETDEITRALTVQRHIQADTAAALAHLAQGDWIAAIQQIETSDETQETLETYQSLMRLAYRRDIRSLARWSDHIATLGRERQRRTLQYYQRMTRECFMYNFHEPQLCYMTQAEEKFASRFAPFVAEHNVADIHQALQQAEQEIAQNASARIVFFSLATQMIILLRQ